MVLETENNPAHTDVNFCFPEDAISFTISAKNIKVCPVQYFDKK